MTTMTNPADRRIAEGYAARHAQPEFERITLEEAGKILIGIAEADGHANLGEAADAELASLRATLLETSGKVDDQFVLDDAANNGAGWCAAAIIWAVRTLGAQGTQTFAYVAEMAKASATRGLSAPQVRGLMNCIRAEVMREAAAAPVAPVAAPVAPVAAPVDDDPDAPFEDDVPEFRRAVEFLQILSQHGLKNPKVRLSTDDGGTMVALSIAGPRSRFPGSLNVTDGGSFGDNVFFGRIDPAGNPNGPLTERPAVMAALREFVIDPEAALVRYGRVTGSCGICGRELTNAESIARGIGPICAEKGGL